MTTTKPLTPEQFETKMKTIFRGGNYDSEVAHDDMDKLMADLLRSLGYEAGIKVFVDTVKWYA